MWCITWIPKQWGKTDHKLRQIFNKILYKKVLSKKKYSHLLLLINNHLNKTCNPSEASQKKLKGPKILRDSSFLSAVEFQYNKFTNLKREFQTQIWLEWAYLKTMISKALGRLGKSQKIVLMKRWDNRWALSRVFRIQQAIILIQAIPFHLKLLRRRLRVRSQRFFSIEGDLLWWIRSHSWMLQLWHLCSHHQ